MNTNLPIRTPDLCYDYRVPIGGMVLFPGYIYEGVDANDEPILKDYLRLGGWLEARGQELDLKEYPELFAVLGYLYLQGGEPQDTFRLPDMRGLFVRGVQNTPRTASDRLVFDDPDAVAGKRLDYSSLQPLGGQGFEEQIGTLEEQELIEHDHRITGLGKLVAGDKGPMVEVFNDATLERKTEPFGGVETRPNNIAMYYLIKARPSRWKITP